MKKVIMNLCIFLIFLGVSSYSYSFEDIYQYEIRYGGDFESACQEYRNDYPSKNIPQDKLDEAKYLQGLSACKRYIMWGIKYGNKPGVYVYRTDEDVNDWFNSDYFLNYIKSVEKLILQALIEPSTDFWKLSGFTTLGKYYDPLTFEKIQKKIININRQEYLDGSHPAIGTDHPPRIEQDYARYYANIIYNYSEKGMKADADRVFKELLAVEQGKLFTPDSPEIMGITETSERLLKEYAGEQKLLQEKDLQISDTSKESSLKELPKSKLEDQEFVNTQMR